MLTLITDLTLANNLIKPLIDNSRDGISFLEQVLNYSIESCDFVNLNNKEELVISTEHELIDYAVANIDYLSLLLADYGIISDYNESSRARASSIW